MVRLNYNVNRSLTHHFLLHILVHPDCIRHLQHLLEDDFGPCNEKMVTYFQRFWIVSRTIELKRTIQFEQGWVFISLSHDDCFGQLGHEADVIHIEYYLLLGGFQI